MRCQEIMKSELECAGPGDTLEDAARRMRDNNVGFLPVCDAAGKVIGTLTDRDIAIRGVAQGRPTSTAAQDIMTRDLVSCRPEDDLETAERLMGSNQKSRILCINDDGQLCGVISLSDLARHAPSPRASQTLRRVSEREARM
jgi:CBS domain-containing protein